jgi:hypothetical protein
MLFNFVDGADIGWFNAEAVWASRSKRLRATASPANSSGKNVNATSVRFGDFELDLRTGELRSIEGPHPQQYGSPQRTNVSGYADAR